MHRLHVVFAIRFATLFAVTTLFLVATLLAAPAIAQDEPAWDDDPTWKAEKPRQAERQEVDREYSRDRSSSDSFVSVRGGLGWTGGPETFLMSLEVPFQLMEWVAVGPQFRLGVSDDEVYFAPTLQAYVTPRLGGDLDDIRPYASFGMGIALLEKDDRRFRRDEKDVDFLLSPGVGIEYGFDDQFFVGSGIQLDVIPAGVAGQRFIFSWQVLTFRAAF